MSYEATTVAGLKQVRVVHATEKQLAPPPDTRARMSPELRLYLMERRRALLTELHSLDKLLQLPPTE
jgi:hypothetical protein